MSPLLPACLWERGAVSSSSRTPCLSHREGLWRLLELSKKPIFIVFESQYREITHPAISLLKQHRSAVTLLVWRAGSMVRAERGPTLVPNFISGSRSACSRPKREGRSPTPGCPLAKETRAAQLTL